MRAYYHYARAYPHCETLKWILMMKCYNRLRFKIIAFINYFCAGAPLIAPMYHYIKLQNMPHRYYISIHKLKSHHASDTSHCTQYCLSSRLPRTRPHLASLSPSVFRYPELIQGQLRCQILTLLSGVASTLLPLYVLLPVSPMFFLLLLFFLFLLLFFFSSSPLTLPFWLLIFLRFFLLWMVNLLYSRL